MPTALAILTLLIIAAAARAQSLDTQRALADRTKNYLNEHDWDYIFYVTTRPWAGYDAKQLKQAIRLVIASDSVQPVIERCAGVDIGNGLMRYDLRDLHWRVQDWLTVAYKRNPYIREIPLVVRADWLLVELSDLADSDSYNRLIFGGDNLPKNRDDIFKFFEVGNKRLINYGLIEGKSGVSKQGRRRIEFRPVPSGFATRTEDVAELDSERDPLEHLLGGSPFDAEEGIIGIVKQSAISGQRGVLQWYYLADGKGNLINRADPDIVEDSTEFRHRRDIHNPGSCIQCHAEGLKQTTFNNARGLRDAQVPILAHYNDLEKIEVELFADTRKPIGRYQDDFQTVVQLACSTPDYTVRDPKTVGGVAFKDSVNRYEEPLPLARQAAELEVTVAEWTRVLGRNGTLPASLSSSVASIPQPDGSVEYGTVARAAWEQYFNQAYDAAHGGGLIKDAVKQVEKPKSAPSTPRQQQGNRRKAA